ncbi:MAG: phosphoglycolate phosphatase [Euryarchaeota archaeon]|nr:phosphoglycolate phosphatase [Euryarchaeota archaeon]
MTPRARVPRGRASPALRAVITDIDGTLTDKDRRMDLDAVAALSFLRRKGIPVVFATGNVLPVVLGLQRFLGLEGPIIAENGGLVYFSEDRVVHLSSREVALKAYERARRSLPVERLFTDRWRETEVALEPTLPAEEVERAVRGCGVRVESTGFAIHLFEPTAGKLPAARMVLQELGVPLEECLVAGDGDNDVELLEAAGVGVSFPDGSARARTRADYVTRARHGAGFLEALIEFSLLPSGWRREGH